MIVALTLLRLAFYWLFRAVNTDGFKPNLENHLIPLLASKLEEASSESKERSTEMPTKADHHPLLMQVFCLSFLQSVSQNFTT